MIGKFLIRLQTEELELLPRKKKRALEEMGLILEKLIKRLSKSKRHSELQTLLELQQVFAPSSTDRWPDYDEIASRWLDIIRPIWFEKLQTPRTRPLLLKDIREDLLARDSYLIEELEKNFEIIPEAVRPEQRIRACILGVG